MRISGHGRVQLSAMPIVTVAASVAMSPAACPRIAFSPPRSFADPYLIIAIQLFDGLGAAVFGVLFPLIVADVTRDTGHYTTSLGLVGLAIGGGATLSTALAGLVADDLGVGAAFLSLAAVGLIATALVWTLMPETRVRANA